MSEIARNIGKLLTANIVAQALGILVYPVLTRMYSPEDFGLLNLFMSIGGIGVIVSTLGYHDAVVLPKDERRSVGLVQLCVIATLCVVLLVGLTIPFSGPIAALFNSPAMARWWWLMPFYIGGMAFWNTISNYYLRRKAFLSISIYQVSQSLFNAAGKIVLGAFGWVAGGMIVSSVVAPFLAIGASMSYGGKLLKAALLPVPKAEMQTIAREYRNFPCYSLPRSLVNVFGSNMPVLLLTPVFGLEEVGFFGMALTLALRPLQLIVQSAYQVLYQRSSQQVNDLQPIGPLLFGFMKKTGALFIPFFALLYGVLPWLTEWLLGGGWKVCGEYIRLLLPWLLVMTIVAPVGFVTDVFGKQKMAFAIEVVYTVLRIGALMIGIALHDFRMALLLFSLSSALVIAGQAGWYIALIRRHDRQVSA